MKKLTRILALVLCAAMLLSMVGCTQKPAETTAPPTEAPTTVPTEPPADQVYAAAREALDNASHVTLELVVTTFTEVAGDVFSEKSTQTLTYKDMGTDNALVLLEEKLESGIHREGYDPEDRNTYIASFREVWSQGTLYTELDSTYRYQGPMDVQALSSRYIPVILLDAALYGEITAQDNAEGTLLTFSQPTAPESWAIPEGAELVDAAGTALVDANGALRQMDYTITYLYGSTQVTKEVQSRPMDAPKTVASPANPDTYTPVENIEIPRMRTTMSTRLLQAESFTVSEVASLFSQAGAVTRNQSVIMNLHGRDQDLLGKLETSIVYMDYTTMETDQYEQEELFLNGSYTYSLDGGEPIEDRFVTWKDFQSYAFELMSFEILDFEDWENITTTELDSLILLEFDLNETFGNESQQSVCDILWENPYFLGNLASSYETREANGYLSLDKYTGLPIAAGYYFEGVHTIDGTPYLMTLQHDKSFEAPAKGAYQEITGEKPAESEPENKATPLFYHVTGENGQEMWLLGTIHVGDERTAYLPEEIYNAFAASDALAVECDTEAFEQQMEEDDALSEEVSGLYFYGGGITLQGLLEEAEYAQALQLLKATGNYNMNMPYAKPYLWSNSIENFYLRQGYQLHGDQGVEERLMDWAQELDKEIREVESSLFQIKMITGFSNDLQIELLRETVENGAQDYWESTWELYELWCAGDEEALRAELSDEEDMSDWTEEEIAEYEAIKHLIDEYNKAMSYDRNDGMLQKAIEYLESGDVVFYAVGLAHLLNDVNGLVDTLREAGYTVELVTYG